MSDNIFNEVLQDVKGVEEKLLGPAYPYYKNIKSPSQIGMSDDGSLSALAEDIDGLISYVEILVTGNSNASTTGGPLGNKFFLKTGAKCKASNTCTDPNDSSTCQDVDRYIYIDNVPAGNIPFISQGLGVDFTEFKGLIPGSMSNLNVLNPYGIMQAFLSGSTPACQELTMQTISVDNVASSETHYVTLTDIQNMDPCTFSNNTNPITKKSCQEAFQNSSPNTTTSVLPDDPLAQIYFAGLALIGIYILYRFMEKSH